MTTIKTPINGRMHTVHLTDEPGEEVVLSSPRNADVLKGTDTALLVVTDLDYFWAIVDACFAPFPDGDATQGGEKVAQAATAWMRDRFPVRPPITFKRAAA